MTRLSQGFRFGGKGPNGRSLCRWCGQEVPPTRKSWCGDTCVDDYLLANDQGAANRRVAIANSKWHCELCGVKCGARTEQATGEYRAVAWQADHRVPLAEGGTGTRDNIRMLCEPCHGRETRALRARLAQKRKVTP